MAAGRGMSALWALLRELAAEPPGIPGPRDPRPAELYRAKRIIFRKGSPEERPRTLKGPSKISIDFEIDFLSIFDLILEPK